MLCSTAFSYHYTCHYIDGQCGAQAKKVIFVSYRRELDTPPLWLCDTQTLNLPLWCHNLPWLVNTATMVNDANVSVNRRTLPNKQIIAILVFPGQLHSNMLIYRSGHSSDLLTLSSRSAGISMFIVCNIPATIPYTRLFQL